MNNPFDSDPTNARNRFPDLNSPGGMLASSPSSSLQPQYPMMGASEWSYPQQQPQQPQQHNPFSPTTNGQYGQQTNAGYIPGFGQTGSASSPFGMTPSGFFPQQQQQQPQSPYGMGAGSYQNGSPFAGPPTNGIGGGGATIRPGFSAGVASGGSYTSGGFSGGGHGGPLSRLGSPPAGDMSAGGVYSSMPTSPYGFGGGAGAGGGSSYGGGSAIISQFDPLSSAQRSVGSPQQQQPQGPLFQLGAPSSGSEIDPGPLIYHPRSPSNPAVQMVSGFNGQTTLHIPIRPHSYSPGEHPRNVIAMHRHDLEQWDPYGWRQSLNALESLRLAWESFRDDVAKVTDIGCPPHENAITHKIKREASEKIDSVTAAYLQMQEVFSSYRQSLDPSSKRRVRDCLNAGVKNLPDWP
ncbi:hypothetical protein FRC17_010152 [Serendipita sp. 399]|nr:hypothetical protein FRC17_010152 [Serendipita sp. 399]